MGKRVETNEHKSSRETATTQTPDTQSENPRGPRNGKKGVEDIYPNETEKRWKAEADA